MEKSLKSLIDYEDKLVDLINTTKENIKKTEEGDLPYEVKKHWVRDLKKCLNEDYTKLSEVRQEIRRFCKSF